MSAQSSRHHLLERQRRSIRQLRVEGSGKPQRSCPFCASDDLVVTRWSDDGPSGGGMRVCCARCEMSGPIVRRRWSDEAARLAIALWERMGVPNGEEPQDIGLYRAVHVHNFKPVPETRYGNMPTILVCSCTAWRAP